MEIWSRGNARGDGVKETGGEVWESGGGQGMDTGEVWCSSVRRGRYGSDEDWRHGSHEGRYGREKWRYGTDEERNGCAEEGRCRSKE